MAGPSGGSSPLAFPTTDIQTAKVWSTRTEREVLPKTIFQTFINSGVAMYKDELTKEAGDQVKFPFEGLMETDGAIQNEVLSIPDRAVGQEAAPKFWQDSIDINQLRFAYRWFGRIDTQRVAMKVRRSARDQLSDTWARVKDFCFLYHIVGDTWIEDWHATAGTLQADNLDYSLKLTGLNFIRPATTNNLIKHDDSKLKLDFIEELLTLAKTMKDQFDQPVFRPIMLEGEEVFPIIMHTFCWRDLRRNTEPGEWLDITKSALAGGLIDRNPIFTGAGGVYGSAVFFESSRMGKISTAAADGTTEPKHRAICLLGKGAICYANGRATPSDDKYLWDEDTYDLRNENVVGSAQIWGMAKTQFGDTGSEYDYGVLRMDVFASPNMEDPPVAQV